MDRVKVLAAGKVGVGGRETVDSNEHDGQPVRGKAGAAALLNILQQTEPTNDGGRENGGALALVVEAHITADDGDPEFVASGRHASDTLLELVVDVRTFGVPEIEAVGEGQRFRTHASQVAGHLGDHALASHVRVKKALASVAVDSDGDSFRRAFDAQHRSIASSGTNDRVGLHLMVVLAVHRPLAGDVGGRQEFEEDLGRVAQTGVRRQRNIRQTQPLSCSVFRRLLTG